MSIRDILYRYRAYFEQETDINEIDCSFNDCEDEIITVVKSIAEGLQEILDNEESTVDLNVEIRKIMEEL